MVYECEDCHKQWYYNVEKCIFCQGDVKELAPAKSTVRGFTKIEIPSPGHTRVPYSDLLLEDEYGNFEIRKSFSDHELGELIEAVPREAKKVAKSRTVGIVGTGTMGTGIAQVCAQTGYHVLMIDRHEEIARKALTKIDKALSKTTKDELKQEILSRIKVTANLYESEHADLMIEVLTEDMELKKEVFRELDNECSVDTIFASNTSSLSLTELSQVLKDPGRLGRSPFLQSGFQG